MIEIKTNYIDEQYFDFNFVNGDIEKTNTVETNIFMSIFCDQRANNSEIPIIENQGGWWGNVFKDVEDGSKVWLTYQRPADFDTTNLLRSYIEKSLQWLIDAQIISKINITVTSKEGVFNVNLILYNSNTIFRKYNFSI